MLGIKPCDRNHAENDGMGAPWPLKRKHAALLGHHPDSSTSQSGFLEPLPDGPPGRGTPCGCRFGKMAKVNSLCITNDPGTLEHHKEKNIVELRAVRTAQAPTDTREIKAQFVLPRVKGSRSSSETMIPPLPVVGITR